MSDPEKPHPDEGADEGMAPAIAAAVANRPLPPRWALHRRLYDWVLGLAGKPRSTLALFVISFTESSFFPIPPDVLLAPLCLGQRRRALWYATVTTAASVLGAFLGYTIGMFLIEYATLVPGITDERIHWLSGEFESRGTWYVFIAALTPIPFKLLTVTAGSMHMALLPFAAACIVGRATRFFAVAGACWWLGPRALPFIDRWFNWLCVLFIVLLVGGFVFLK